MGDSITLGPVLFNWSPDVWRDFYFRIADEAPVDCVYLGEVVCVKRAPFLTPLYDNVAARLIAAGKQVVFSTLAEVMTGHERASVAGLCALAGSEPNTGPDIEIEANDASALYHLRGRAHRVGPFVNVYNEITLAELAQRGAVHVTLPAELKLAALAPLGRRAANLGIGLEVQVFGRLPLALSARCYHARAHGRVKDNCQFVCEQDADGMVLRTLDGVDFLAVNGIQTLSHACLDLLGELETLRDLGIRAFRLSPHSLDMVAVAELFRAVLTGQRTAAAAQADLHALWPGVPYANGFVKGVAGHRWVAM